MAISQQEKEFTAFGIISNRLRAGLVIGLLSLSICGNIFLVKELVSTQKDLYGQMLERVDKTVNDRVNDKLDAPVKQIHESVEKVNNSVNQVDSLVNNSKGLINNRRR